MKHRSRFVLLAVLAGLGACRSAQTRPAGEPLPFHVALMPTDVKPPEPSTGEPDMQLTLDPAEVVQALAQGLGQHGFARVTVLAADEEESAGLASATSSVRDAHWQDRARALGADLLVRTTLSYEPAIETHANDRFWLNLPLFFLGGPFCWFVADRSYEVSARLQADFYDVSDVHDELPQWALLPLPLYVEFERADLDFIERADGVGDYALSFLVPAGLLARGSDKVAAEVEEQFLASLGEQLVAKVQAERARFEQNQSLWSFRVHGPGARAERNADGSVSVAVPVQAMDGRTPPFRYEIRTGAALLEEGEFGAAEADGRHWIRGSVPLEAVARFVSVRVEDQRNRSRSYTLAVQERTR